MTDQQSSHEDDAARWGVILPPDSGSSIAPASQHAPLSNPSDEMRVFIGVQGIKGNQELAAAALARLMHTMGPAHALSPVASSMPPIVPQHDRPAPPPPAAPNLRIVRTVASNTTQSGSPGTHSGPPETEPPTSTATKVSSHRRGLNVLVSTAVFFGSLGGGYYFVYDRNATHNNRGVLTETRHDMANWPIIGGFVAKIVGVDEP